MFKDKHILITGASRGLGSVCARAFAEKGARLALMARSKNGLENVIASCPNPERHIAVPTDLLDIKELRHGITLVNDFSGGLDVVLHVAGGGLGLREPLINSDDLLKLFALNVVAAVEINRLVIPDMIKRGRGNLVHVASVASSEATASVGYNTVKAATAAYVRSLGNELIKSGVIATGILPGGFYAPGNAMQRLEKNNPDVYQRFIEERLPRKKMGTAEELIPLILFLSSDEASMMGGCMVPIDAGEGKAYLPG